MKRFILLFFSAFILSSQLSAQNINIFDGFLESPSFGKPFLSEIHSTLTKVEMGYSKSYNEFNIEKKSQSFNRPVVELHLGVEIPLYFLQFGENTDKNPKWGFGITLPVSVHVLEDMFESITAPVINTDYRFGLPRISAIRYFNNNDFIRNISISWLPLFHECTHLGDEITIYRMNENLPITRVNVSYEYTELQLTLNDPDKIKDNLHSFKLGMIYRISDRGLGWFDIRKDAEATVEINVPKSTRRFEYYFEYQFQRTAGFLASERAVNIFSFEARNRIRYGYPIYKLENSLWIEKNVQESREWALNLYIGWKFYSASKKNALGLFIHLYNGINPYGQLRNYPRYPFIGISLTYDY